MNSNILGTDISSTVFIFSSSSIVATPTSSRSVAAISNRQNVLLLHFSLASRSSVELVKVVWNIGTKPGKWKVLQLSAALYVKRLSDESFIIPTRQTDMT